MPLHQEEVATLESVKDYYGKVRARTRGTSGRGGGRGASGRGCAPLARAWPSRTHTHTHKQVLSTSKDLKTSACTAAGRPHPKILEIFKKIPTEVMEKFYGCGAPLPLGIDGLCPPSRLVWRAQRRRAALLCGAPPRVDADCCVARELGLQACRCSTWGAAPVATATLRRRWWARVGA